MYTNLKEMQNITKHIYHGNREKKYFQWNAICEEKASLENQVRKCFQHPNLDPDPKPR